mmetsp:Transcript_12578/g.25653  ORF Transcript_12578/g.25653 Transcript_12578/m.25653 type:complete len:219 (+) Transcript_12578:17-673(+)
MIGQNNSDDSNVAIAPPTGTLNTSSLPPAPPTMQPVAMSPPASSADSSEDILDLDEDGDSTVEKSGIEQAIPMDKIKNGATQAMADWSWFASTVSAKAAEAKKQLEQNQTYQSSVAGLNVQLEKARQSEVGKKAGEAGSIMVAGIVGVGETVSKSTVQGVNYVRENAAPAMEATQKFAEDVGEKTLPIVKNGFAVCTVKAGEAAENVKKAVGSGAGRA